MLEIIKFGLLALTVLIVGLQFISVAKTYIRNAAIDGCARNSLYQTQFVNAEKQTITISEPQKELYQNCLINKGVSIQK